MEFVDAILPVLARAQDPAIAPLVKNRFTWSYSPQLRDAVNFYLEEVRKDGMSNIERQGINKAFLACDIYFAVLAGEDRRLIVPLSSLLAGDVHGSEDDWVRACMSEFKDNISLFYRMCVPSMRDPLSGAEREMLAAAYTGNEALMLNFLEVTPLWKDVPFSGRMIKSLSGGTVLSRQLIDCGLWIAYKRGHLKFVRKMLTALQNELEGSELGILYIHQWALPMALIEAAVQSGDAETLRLLFKSKRLVGRETLSPLGVAIRLQALTSADKKIRNCVAQDLLDRRSAQGGNPESSNKRALSLSQRSLLLNFLTEDEYSLGSRMASWGSQLELNAFTSLEISYLLERLTSAGRLDILKECLAKLNKLSLMDRQKLVAIALASRHEAVARFLAKVPVQ
jgi:hypothetical protein